MNRRQQPDRVRSAADTGEREVRQAPLDGPELGGRLVADPALQVAHDRRDGCGPIAEPTRSGFETFVTQVAHRLR